MIARGCSAISEDGAAATGKTVIETMGIAHTIVFTVDHVTNEPRLTHNTAPSPVAAGTRITIKWRPSSDGVGFVLDNAEERFKAPLRITLGSTRT